MTNTPETDDAAPRARPGASNDVGRSADVDGDASDGTTWHDLDVDAVLEHLDTNQSGLDGDEAAERLDEHGPNRLAEHETASAWQVLLNQFTSPLVYVLLAALVVTSLLGSWSDAIVIAIVLTVNATVGFWQELQAKRAVESLKDLISPTATVRRDGEDRDIDAADLVPGDIVTIGQGSVIPADARLVEVSGLRVDEAPLTGESVPIDKQASTLDDEKLPPADQSNMVFMGTAVTSGEGTAVIVATGSRTEIGQISEQVESASAGETPLEERINQLARWITIGILAVAAVATGIGLAIGRSLGDMIELSVALAVSAIPAGLPVVVTVALAIGVSRMAERNAVIQQLTAVDTLGSCSVIVSDKTGTLTRNEMTVQRIAAGDTVVDLADADDPASALRQRCGENEALRQTLRIGVLCNDAPAKGLDQRSNGTGANDPAQDQDGNKGGSNEQDKSKPENEAESESPAASGDPMELALLQSAQLAGWDADDLRARHPERDRVPFRTEQRFMAVIRDSGADEDNGESPIVAVKGAPERVAAMCDQRLDANGQLVPFDPDELTTEYESMARQGLRVLAMAVGRGDEAAETIQGDDPSGLTFVGLQGLLDPPRDSAVRAVEDARAAGIRTVMVTGDHATTAAAIGQQVRLDPDLEGGSDAEGDQRTVTGRELDELSDDALEETLRDTVVFSRVVPEQKLRIVNRLQEQGEVVAVTGDGVNDAPALKAADIGAAMGSGTDVAKEASEMVITDDDFASVHAAVEEGRTAFRNIRMATFFLLSTGAAEVLFIMTTLILDWPLPLLAAQILWLNVVTNGLADVALAFEPGDDELYTQTPRRRDEGILTRMLLERLAVVSVFLAVVGVGVFWWYWNGSEENLTEARTVTLTAFVLFQAVHVFNCRSERRSVFARSPFTNRFLLAGVAVSLVIHIGAMYLPPMQNLLSIEPLTLTAWVIAFAVGASAVLINETHKRLRPHTAAGGKGSDS